MPTESCRSTRGLQTINFHLKEMQTGILQAKNIPHMVETSTDTLHTKDIRHNKEIQTDTLHSEVQLTGVLAYVMTWALIAPK